MAPLGALEGCAPEAGDARSRRIGITVHQADCLIAAAAVGIGAALATANVSDFPMAELRVEHWPVGS